MASKLEITVTNDVVPTCNQLNLGQQVYIKVKCRVLGQRVYSYDPVTQEMGIETQLQVLDGQVVTS